MRRWLLAALLAGSMAVGGEVYTHGQFAMRCDGANAELPGSIEWVPAKVELLAPETGLNLSFTSFEFRNKFYREENGNVWRKQKDPRFVTDVAGEVTAVEVSSGAWAGIAARYASSYAEVTRTVLFHDSEARLRIVYELRMTREMVLHEAGNLALQLKLGEAFGARGMVNPEAADGSVVVQDGMGGAGMAVSVLASGPALATGNGGQLGALVMPGVAGDVPVPPPSRLLVMKAGTRLELSAEIRLATGDLEPLRAELVRLAKAQPAWQRPYTLVEWAKLLNVGNKPEQAEAALLEAARLDTAYAVPFGMLAAIRRDRKLPGEAEAWAEGGWRNPYNYGYTLSASGYGKTEGLTEEQRRLHSFNVLIAVENCAFYPDYYVWGARDFEARGMWSQACAMYRQALWAVQYMPRTEAAKAKFRQKCEKKIAELEARIVGQTATALPEELPLRVGVPEAR